MTNRLLLLIVAGLGGLTVLLCLVLMWRESSNGASITALRADLRAAREQQEKQHGELLAELKTTRADLAALGKTLDQTRGSLEQTGQALQQARQTLAFYKSKPWLNRKDKQEPWKGEFDALLKRLTELEKKFPRPDDTE